MTNLLTNLRNEVIFDHSKSVLLLSGEAEGKIIKKTLPQAIWGNQEFSKQENVEYIILYI